MCVCMRVYVCVCLLTCVMKNKRGGEETNKQGRLLDYSRALDALSVCESMCVCVCVMYVCKCAAPLHERMKT